MWKEPLGGGGFWERLIQTVKRSLRKSIGRSNLTYQQLSTLIAEVECVINSRPLTYISDDSDGIVGCLTPSHLLNGRRIAAMSNSAHFEVVITYQSLTFKLKHHRHLLDQFLKQWRRDYLLNLRESHSLKAKSGGHELIQVGDVVVLKNDTSKHIFWRLAVVNELLKGSDGKVRAAVVKLGNPRGGHKLLRRSVKHLFPIEVHHSEVIQQQQLNQDSDSSDNSSNSRPDSEVTQQQQLNQDSDSSDTSSNSQPDVSSISQPDASNVRCFQCFSI